MVKYNAVDDVGSNNSRSASCHVLSIVICECRELRSGAQREAQHRQGATLRDADLHEGTKTKGQAIRMRNVKGMLEDKNTFLRAYDDKILALGLQVRSVSVAMVLVLIILTWRLLCAYFLQSQSLT